MRATTSYSKMTPQTRNIFGYPGHRAKWNDERLVKLAWWWISRREDFDVNELMAFLVKFLPSLVNLPSEEWRQHNDFGESVDRMYSDDNHLNRCLREIEWKLRAKVWSILNVWAAEHKLMKYKPERRRYYRYRNLTTPTGRSGDLVYIYFRSHYR